MFRYGFRIPFLLAGVLGIIGYQIRKNTTETPLFLAQQKTDLARIPIITLLRHHLPRVFIGLGLVWSGAVLVNFGLFLPSFLQIHFGYLPKDTYLATTIAFALDFLLIIFGMLADKITFRRLYLIGVISNMICIYPLFLLLKNKSVAVLYVFMLLYHLLILILAACYPAMLARIFPTNIRYSGVSLSYVGAYSIAGFIPVIINSVFTRFPSVVSLSSCIFFALIISLVAGLYYKNSELV
jgi:nitrate/nitrite transporter NarK